MGGWGKFYPFFKNFIYFPKSRLIQLSSVVIIIYLNPVCLKSMQALLVSFYCQNFHIFGYLLDLPDRLFTFYDVSCRIQLFDLISAPLRFMYACHLTMLVCVIIYYSDAAHLASIKEAFRCATISHIFFDDSTPRGRCDRHWCRSVVAPGVELLVGVSHRRSQENCCVQKFVCRYPAYLHQWLLQHLSRERHGCFSMCYYIM